MAPSVVPLASLKAALDLLDTAQELPRGVPVDFVLHDGWVRFLLVTWPGQPTSFKERAALEQAWFNRVYPAAGSWRVGRDGQLTRGQELLAALDHEDWRSLEASAKRMGWRVRSIRPVFAAAFDAARKGLEGERGAMIVMAGERASVALWEDGGWRAFRSVAVSGLSTLAEQIAQMRLSLQKPDAGPLRVFVSGQVPEHFGVLPEGWSLADAEGEAAGHSQAEGRFLPKPLRLDIHRSSGPSKVIGWCLLAAGIACAALLGASQAQRGEAALRQQDEIARLKRLSERLRAVQVRLNPADDKDLRRAALLVRGLSAPWPDLLPALEALTGKDVALLTLDADAQKGSLRLTGRSRDLASLFAFMRNLEQSPLLRAPRLSSYATKQEGAIQLVDFDLVAGWAGP